MNCEIEFVKVSYAFEFFTNTQGWQCWHYCQLCVRIYLQFLSLFTLTDVSKCEIRNKGVHEDCILRLNATSNWLIFNDRAKTKLAFLYCAEIVKNFIVDRQAPPFTCVIVYIRPECDTCRPLGIAADPIPHLIDDGI